MWINIRFPLGSGNTNLQLTHPHKYLESPESLKNPSECRRQCMTCLVLSERKSCFYLWSTNSEKVPNSISLAVMLYVAEGKRTPFCTFYKCPGLEEGGREISGIIRIPVEIRNLPSLHCWASWDSLWIFAFWSVLWLRLQQIFPSSSQCY